MDKLTEWRPIARHEATYAINDMGRIWSWRIGRVLRVSVTKKGYARARLYVSREIPTDERYIHQLVMEAFVGPRMPGFEVNHIDGDPLNNALVNLEYVRHCENMTHALRTLRRNTNGKRIPLSMQERADIRTLRDIGLSVREIAGIYKRDKSRIEQICRRIACGPPE